MIGVVSVGGKPTKMDWVDEYHADVALAKPPPMLKLVREKDFRVFMCTFNFYCLFFFF